MPQVIPGTRALPVAQKGFREGYKATLTPAVEQVGRMLQRAAGPDGTIDRRRETTVVEAAGDIIQRVYSAGRRVYGEDGATPLSPYATVMNQWVASVTVKAVRNHQRWMQRQVPEDVYNWLRRARRPQNVREMIDVAARLLPGFIPNAFAQYDPLHLWVDPNGYVLSDRIWRMGTDTRTRLDAMIAESIRRGDSALNISKMAERFMLPGRAALRTNKPYGTDASYRGMVLGRTEIARAHGWATILSARLNPYVEGVDWALSASHPKLDICDDLATLGMGGGRLREPYGLYDVPAYPPHPQCLCNLQSVVTADMQSVTDDLRQWMEQDEDPPLTPAADDSLLWLLLGAAFYEWWQRNQEGVAA